MNSSIVPKESRPAVESDSFARDSSYKSSSGHTKSNEDISPPPEACAFDVWSDGLSC